MKNFMKKKVRGVVSFEYIIILVFMAVAIFTAWGILADAITTQVNNIANLLDTQFDYANPWSPPSQ